jgi:flagellar motility protein MotE (MotC chaperone)
MKTVEIDGITIEVADDAIAEKLIAKRQETKEKTRSLAAELEETRRKIAAIDQEKAEQLEAEKVKSLADKKKFDEALAAIKTAHEAKLKAAQAETESVSREYLNEKLRAAVATHPDIVPSAVDDVVSIIRGGCSYDSAAKVVRVLDGSSPKLGEDGAPMKVDAFINEALATRPHFRKATATPGSGGASGAGGTKVGQTITNEAFLAMSPTQRAASLPKKP